MSDAVTVKRLTTMIVVDQIEPCLPFWVDRLGFEKTIEVPGDDGGLNFAALAKDGTELMYMTYTAVEEDNAAVRSLIGKPSSIGLFIEVTSLEAVKEALEGLEMLFDERTTFYGAREVAVKSPCGTPITFAEMTGQ